MTTPLIEAIALALESCAQETTLGGDLAMAALTAILEAGYAVVPIEPTREMIDAGFRPVGFLIDGRKTLEKQWSAMISAAQGDG